MLQDTSPFLLDGITPEDNVSDDPQDEWFVYSSISDVADNFVDGIPNDQFQFVPAGGDT